MTTPLAARLRRTAFAMTALIASAAISTATKTAAEPLRVLADIAPVGSLAAMVMGDLGAPQVLVPAGASAHTLSLRPSQARAVQQADLVIWVGPAMAPWLGEALESLAPQGRALALMEAQGTHLLPARAAIAFEAGHEGGEADRDDHEAHEGHDLEADGHEAHDHEEHDKEGHANEGHDHEDHHEDHKEAHSAAHEEEHEKEHETEHGRAGHDTHDTHDAQHDDHADHDTHDEHEDEHEEGHDDHAAAQDHHDHDHGSGEDPHVWLDPKNAVLWLDVIAAAMAEADPDNAAQYRRNAKAGQAQITEAAAQARAQLDAAARVPILAFHDAYQYFERAFDLNVIGAVSLSDASDPGPARIAALRDLVRARAVRCAITEPQFAARRLDLVLEGRDVRRVEVDPMGYDLAQGAGLYPALILAMAERLARCAAP
ncbi:zinc ABC transporter substrate-binding protein [Litorivita sp. NS0012-18]|uniref:zinc ABC transporter substrate-binding protein n=1 Tax=Litorivita sp. NS0012-18 TaxID=3127655 RepID=UPI00310826D9